MPVTIFSLNAAVTQGIITANNGLNLSTPTNAQLGGLLTSNTSVGVQTFAFTVQGFSGIQLVFLQVNNNQILLEGLDGSGNAFYVRATPSLAELAFVAGGTSAIQALVTGLNVLDQNFNIGLVAAADYSTNIIANQNAYTTVKAVQALITAVFNPALYALVAGQIFTGNISAPNLSGTNTGDQNLTPYALLAGAAFVGNVTAPNLPRIVISNTFINRTTTGNLFVFAVPADGTYRVSLFFSMTAYTSGSGALAFNYTDWAGNAASVAISTGNSVADATLSPRQLNAKSGTNITVSYTVTGTNTATIGGCLEFLF